MAMWQRYSVIAECDMQPVSRDTKACTSPTPSLRISMTAMAAYGLGPWKSDPLWTHFKTSSSVYDHMAFFYVFMSHTLIPRLKCFWTSGIRSLMEASAWGKRRCFFTRSRTSSGLTRSPTLCWAIKLIIKKTYTHTQWHFKNEKFISHSSHIHCGLSLSILFFFTERVATATRIQERLASLPRPTFPVRSEAVILESY